MSTVAANVNRVDPTLDLDADLKRARWLATLMDAQFQIAGFRFGLDPVVGLVPGIGDTVTAIAALYPLYVAQKHGLGKVVLTRMALNVSVDWLAGLVPVVGDLVDAGFKANLANVDLLEKAVAGRR
jgi:hypothetical protein